MAGEPQITNPTPAYVSKNRRPGFRECIDLFCHAYDAWGTHYHEDVMSKPPTQTTEPLSPEQQGGVDLIEKLARVLQNEFSDPHGPDGDWARCTEGQRDRWRRSATAVMCGLSA